MSREAPSAERAIEVAVEAIKSLISANSVG